MFSAVGESAKKYIPGHLFAFHGGKIRKKSKKRNKKPPKLNSGGFYLE
jgi:hypothetical protein